MTTNRHREYTQNEELGDLRRNTSDQARCGAVARGELPSYTAAVLERMGELVEAGYYAEARAMHRREIEGAR